MASAFASWRQAFAFVLLLLTVLCLPAICGHLGLLSRPNAYSVMPAGGGDYAYLRQQVFEEKSDLDVVFLGASGLLCGVNTPYIQKELSLQLGRQARVITMGSAWEAEDRNYFVLRDLLLHRRVRMVVLKPAGDDAWQKNPHFTDLYNQPHPWLHRFFQIGPDSEALAGLPLRSQAAVYGGAVLGLPRHLLSIVRPDLLAQPSSAPNLGSMPERVGYGWNGGGFVTFSPTPPHLPPARITYPPAAWEAVPCSNRPIGPYPRHFIRKMGQLLREHRVHLVILQVPWLQPVGRDKPIEEAVRWPELFGMPADLIAVPPAPLFAGLTNTEFKRLWCDDVHFNANGMDYFTRVIAPAIVELYGQDANP